MSERAAGKAAALSCMENLQDLRDKVTDLCCFRDYYKNTKGNKYLELQTIPEKEGILL